MQVFNTPQRYGAVVQVLHWATVILVVAAWLLGTFGDDLPRGAARDAGLYIHMTAGLTVIAIVVLRMLWRTVDAPPAPEKTPLGPWLDRAGRLAHVVLYVLLIAVPIAGYFAISYGRYLEVFGVPLPAITEKSDADPPVKY